METKIVLKDWKVIQEDGKQKIIAGAFNVMCGATLMATSEFNSRYNATTIAIPAELMAAAEKLDGEIKNAIENHFTN